MGDKGVGTGIVSGLLLAGDECQPPLGRCSTAASTLPFPATTTNARPPLLFVSLLTSPFLKAVLPTLFGFPLSSLCWPHGLNRYCSISAAPRTRLG